MRVRYRAGVSPPPHSHPHRTHKPPVIPSPTRELTIHMHIQSTHNHRTYTQTTTRPPTQSPTKAEERLSVEHHHTPILPCPTRERTLHTHMQSTHTTTYTITHKSRERANRRRNMIQSIYGAKPLEAEQTPEAKKMGV